MTENEKIRQHEAICAELTALYKKKNRDYGDAFHTSFLEEGMAMPRIRLGDKFNRFKNLPALVCGRLLMKAFGTP